MFIVGYSRSGTTLLQLLIAAHDGFRTGRETHLFKHALVPVENWRSGFIDRKGLNMALDRLSRKSELVLDMVALERLRAEAEQGLRVSRLLHEIMLHLVGEANDTGFRWVEKSPRHAMYIPEILSLYPKARIINMIRDPRDVVSSRIKVRHFASRTEEFFYYLMRADEWRSYVAKSLAYGEDSKRVKHVLYEDLAAHPGRTMGEIMAFLGHTFEEQSLETFADNYPRVILPWENRHKNLCAKGTIINRTGIWKERITPGQARMVELLCDDLMKGFGYTPQKPVREPGKFVCNFLVRGSHSKRWLKGKFGLLK